MAARKWTHAQKIAQGKAIRGWRPWRYSTGPRTRVGKEKASKNSIKHGCFSRWVYKLKAMERYGRGLHFEGLEYADEVERFRLLVSKKVSEIALRKGDAKALLIAHHFISLQTVRTETNLLCHESAWLGYQAPTPNKILRC